MYLLIKKQSQFDRNLVDDWLDNFDNLNEDIKQRSFLLKCRKRSFIKTRYNSKISKLSRERDVYY